MSTVDVDPNFDTDDHESGGSGGGGSGTGNPRKPFKLFGHQLQAELAQGEKQFGEIDWSVRISEPPAEETQEDSYSEESALAAANDNVAQPHEWLTCQQFDGRDPKRDPRIPSIADLINYAENHPEAQLTLDPNLRLALENAQRNQHSAAPILKPTGM